MDAPLFKSAQEAVRFACGYNLEVYPRTKMNQMAQPSSGKGGSGKGGLDGAGNAGFILAEVSRLPKIQGCCLIARCAPHFISCTCGSDCCSRKKPNWHWMNVIGELNSDLRNLMQQEKTPGKRGMVDHPELRRAIIIKHFGETIHLGKLAKRCEVNEGTVSNHRAFIVKALKSAEKDAWKAIDERLRELGIVGEV